MEAAQKAQSPVIVQLGHGEGKFLLGEGIGDSQATTMEPVPPHKAATAGAIALAMHVRSVAGYYGIPVVLHTDHCARNLLPWFEGMLAADEEYFGRNGEPLFSSHMLDLSAEPDEENIATCVEYFKRLQPMKIWLEVEIGITGGEEDGVNNEDVDTDKLYTTSKQVWSVYEALSKVGPMFSIAVAFGNVHGVYRPGDVTLAPEKLGTHQAYAKAMLGNTNNTNNSYNDSSNSSNDLNNPLYLVMHGGSGSSDDEINLAVSHGVIKMNINTDTQWAYWDGLRGYEKNRRAYLQDQIGNPGGNDRPNKQFYDPRVWIRKAEESMVKRVMVSMDKLSTTGTYDIAAAQKNGNGKSETAYGQIGLETPRPGPILIMAAGAVLGSAATLLLSAIFSRNSQTNAK